MTYHKNNSIFTYIDKIFTQRIQQNKAQFHVFGIQEEHYTFFRIYLVNSILTHNLRNNKEYLLALCEAFIDPLDFFYLHFKLNIQCKIHFRRTRFPSHLPSLSYAALSLDEYFQYFPTFDQYEHLIFIPDSNHFHTHCSDIKDPSIYDQSQFFPSLHVFNNNYKSILTQLGWYRFLPPITHHSDNTPKNIATSFNAVELVFDIIKDEHTIDITHSLVNMFNHHSSH